MGSTTNEKKQLRARAKTTRIAAYARHGAQGAEQVAAHGLEFADPPATAIISGFLPIGDEIDPLPLLRRLSAAGHPIALPVMIGKDQPLVFRRWQEGDALAEAMWGIREPLDSSPEVEPDVLLVPLLAFDGRGYRLGYGGGFYDRSLAGLRGRKRVISIGLAFDEQRLDAVPHTHYDQRLDWVLTPSGPIRCSGCGN